MRTRRHPARPRPELPLVVVTAVLVVVTVACGDGTLEAATTAATTTTTVPTTTTTTTTTTVPSGTVSGRVYLLDREEPVATAVDLVREEEHEAAATTGTDGEGYYSFSVEEAGSYQVQVSVFDLLEVCEYLRTEGEMSALRPVVSRVYSGSGVSDVRAVSLAESVVIGGAVTFDLDLYCD